jgi:hypothetical protein
MQPSDDWKEAIKKWYKSNGLSEPRDHDTPSVSDNLGPLQHLSLRPEQFKLQNMQQFSLHGGNHRWVWETPKPRTKPFLTAADICFLRDMKVGL